jgi:hypothetical protein
MITPKYIKRIIKNAVSMLHGNRIGRNDNEYVITIEKNTNKKGLQLFCAIQYKVYELYIDVKNHKGPFPERNR